MIQWTGALVAPLGPIARRDLVARLRQLGFTGPFPGGDHEYMRRGATRIPVPNPHRGDIGPGLLARVLRDAGIARAEWERTG